MFLKKNAHGIFDRFFLLSSLVLMLDECCDDGTKADTVWEATYRAVARAVT